MGGCCRTRAPRLKRDAVERLMPLDEGDLGLHRAVHGKHPRAFAVLGEVVDSTPDLGDGIPNLRLASDAAPRATDDELTVDLRPLVGHHRLKQPTRRTAQLDLDVLRCRDHQAPIQGLSVTIHTQRTFSSAVTASNSMRYVLPPCDLKASPAMTYSKLYPVASLSQPFPVCNVS